MIRQLLSRALAVGVLQMVTSSAWADWAVVGAAYECTNSKFALYATVEEGSGGIISRPKGTKPLNVGDNQLSCNLAGTPIVARVGLSGPGHNGICGDPGTISIYELQVSGTDVFSFIEQMLFYCSGEPTIVSVEIARTSHGVSAKICKGIWNWGSSFENVRCERKRYTKHGKLVQSSRSP
jgi:hypothetical protein